MSSKRLHKGGADLKDSSMSSSEKNRVPRMIRLLTRDERFPKLSHEKKASSDYRVRKRLFSLKGPYEDFPA
jgi:hypothetical protein